MFNCESINVYFRGDIVPYIQTLTGLRGFAVLIVFISHLANDSLLPKILGDGFGQTGVMLFFILSGFLMSHLYINKDFNHINVKKYALARIARVLPLYFAVLLLSILITTYVYKDFYYNFNHISRFLRALFLINSPYPLWTIPVEVQFYTAFLGFWFLFKKYNNPYLLGTFIILAMLPSIVIYFCFSKVIAIFSMYSHAFFIGIVTAIFQTKIKTIIRFKKTFSLMGYPLIALLLLNAPNMRREYEIFGHSSDFIITWIDPITWLIVYSIFICALLDSKSLSFLKTTPFIFLGKISYGFYLIHTPFLKYFKTLDIAPVLQIILTFSATIILSHLSFKYFESPIAGKLRKLP